MNRKMYLASVLLVAFMSMVMMTGCTKAGSASKGTNFGNYPADYRIAYVSSYGSMLGLPNTLSVRTLFGPDAYFITSFNGVPAVVTLESAEGTQKSFTAQLLLSVKASEGAGNEDVKIMRMQLTFESDSTSEMSYLRYVKVTNMQTGRITEERAYGDERSDAGLLAFFAGFWSEGLIWDVSKYSQ